MTLIHILILAAVQGAAELLPVSSSAHVIVAERLMGLDPASPEMTLLLVMLHTGTMFAVLLYFWRSWRDNYFGSRAALWRFAKGVAAATAVTGVVGLSLKYLIEKVVLGHVAHAEIEMLFGNMNLIATALFAVGILIVCAGKLGGRGGVGGELNLAGSSFIGAVQGLCLPFRGFSRSGATISAGLFLGVDKARLEEFSFALAVVLTPPVIVREVLRLLKAKAASGAAVDLASLFLPSLLGMAMSFLAGLLALKWLSSWLERGRWQVFGYYCLAASALVFGLHRAGYI